MESDKLFLRSHLYIPINCIDVDDVKKHYDHHRYEELVCKKCEFRRIRFSEECASCEKGGYLGSMRTWGTKTLAGETYVSLPIGDRLKIEHKLGIEYSQFKVIDRRNTSPMRYPIGFRKKFKLKPEQEELKQDWLEAKHGVIKAPPRTGKTVTSLAILIELGQKAVIVANQKDYLKNFIEEIEEWTNLPKLQKKAGKKLYGWLEKDEDYRTCQIGIITYQSLINDKGGARRRRMINKYFGAVWIDEIQKANANEFSKLISNLRVKYKGGCTATDKRKDKKHFLVKELVGSVVGAVTIDTLTPEVFVHETPDVVPRRQFTGGPGAWVSAMKFLSSHDLRNRMVVDQVLEDLKANRSIVLPVYFKDHSKELVDMINKEWGSTIAVQFVGGAGKAQKAQREQHITDARSGKIRVVCGTRSLLQVGLNVPRWDTHYYFMPMSNQPNWEQESSRILTPALDGMDKQEPIIRMFVDPELGQSIGCFKATWRHSQILKHQFSPSARQWFALNVGMSKKERDLSGMDESELAEMNREHNQKRAKENAKGSNKNRPGNLLKSMRSW